MRPLSPGYRRVETPVTGADPRTAVPDRRDPRSANDCHQSLAEPAGYGTRPLPWT